MNIQTSKRVYAVSIKVVQHCDSTSVDLTNKHFDVLEVLVDEACAKFDDYLIVKKREIKGWKEAVKKHSGINEWINFEDLSPKEDSQIDVLFYDGNTRCDVLCNLCTTEILIIDYTNYAIKHLVAWKPIK